jgi:hypothetical protein
MARGLSAARRDQLEQHPKSAVAQISLPAAVHVSRRGRPTPLMRRRTPRQHHIHTLYQTIRQPLGRRRRSHVVIRPHRAEIRDRDRGVIWDGGEALHSRLAGSVDRIGIIFIPLILLLMVQASSLRYQSEAINWLQRVTLMISLGSILWFFKRRRSVVKRTSEEEADRHWRSPWLTVLFVSAIELIFVIPLPRIPATQRADENQTYDRQLVPP